MRIITHDDGRCLTLRLMGELNHAAAQTVMPKTKLPSTVRSGVFKIRKVTNTPRAMGA